MSWRVKLVELFSAVFWFLKFAEKFYPLSKFSILNLITMNSRTQSSNFWRRQNSKLEKCEYFTGRERTQMKDDTDKCGVSEISDAGKNWIAKVENAIKNLDNKKTIKNATSSVWKFRKMEQHEKFVKNRNRIYQISYFVHSRPR